MPAPKNNHNHLKHGLSHTRIDNIYKSMISRCYKKNNNRYDRDRKSNYYKDIDDEEHFK